LKKDSLFIQIMCKQIKPPTTIQGVVFVNMKIKKIGKKKGKN